MMRNLAIAGAAGSVLYLIAKRPRRDQIPAQVAEHAAAELGRASVDPCGGGGGGARTYSDLYVQQKQALIAKFGGAMLHNCGGSSFGPCLPVPTKEIPTASVTCTLRVIDQWRGIADRLAADPATVGSLRDDLRQHSDSLRLLAAMVRAIGQQYGSNETRLIGDTNRRVWSAITRLHIALAGVHIHHGDAAAESSAELVKTLTSPSSYVGVAADALGAAAGAVAKTAGDGVARALFTGPGALVALGAIGYFALRRAA